MKQLPSNINSALSNNLSEIIAAVNNYHDSPTYKFNLGTLHPCPSQATPVSLWANQDSDSPWAVARSILFQVRDRIKARHRLSLIAQLGFSWGICHLKERSEALENSGLSLLMESKRKLDLTPVSPVIRAAADSRKLHSNHWHCGESGHLGFVLNICRKKLKLEWKKETGKPALLGN